MNYEIPISYVGKGQSLLSCHSDGSCFLAGKTGSKPASCQDQCAVSWSIEIWIAMTGNAVCADFQNIIVAVTSKIWRLDQPNVVWACCGGLDVTYHGWPPFRDWDWVPDPCFLPSNSLISLLFLFPYFWWGPRMFLWLNIHILGRLHINNIFHVLCFCSLQLSHDSRHRHTIHIIIYIYTCIIVVILNDVYEIQHKYI